MTFPSVICIAPLGGWADFTSGHIHIGNGQRFVLVGRGVRVKLKAEPTLGKRARKLWVYKLWRRTSSNPVIFTWVDDRDTIFSPRLNGFATRVFQSNQMEASCIASAIASSTRKKLQMSSTHSSVILYHFSLLVIVKVFANADQIIMDVSCISKQLNYIFLTIATRKTNSRCLPPTLLQCHTF